MSGTPLGKIGLAVYVMTLCGACPHHQQQAAKPLVKEKPLSKLPPPPPSWLPEIRSFSETQPYTSMTLLSNTLYVGTPSGVIRFDLGSGEVVQLNKSQGLAGDHVFALSGNVHSGLWIATEGGISRFHQGVWTNIKVDHPQNEAFSAMAAMSDGFWAGGKHGLGRYQNGQWKNRLPGARITYLLADLAGDGVWAGTDGEGIYHLKHNEITSYSAGKGQLIRQVKTISSSQEGGLFALGRDQAHELLGFFDGSRWTTYILDPPGLLRWLQPVQSELLFGYGQTILTLHRYPTASEIEKGIVVPQGPVKLIQKRATPRQPDYPVPRYYTERKNILLPTETTDTISDGQKIFIGTTARGAAMYNGQNILWLRTNDLTGDATRLKMACQGEACYLAGGDGKAYRFTGESFEPIKAGDDPAATVQAFVNDSSGVPVSIVSLPDGQTLAVGRLADKKFLRLYEVKIAIPEGKVQVRFTRFDPAGKLWVGLSYKDNQGDIRPWGVAVLAPGTPPLYHRDSLLPTEDRIQGSLALPDDIRDVSFIDGDIWMATSSGACRIRGMTVDLFTENDEMLSELVYQVVKSPQGDILAATFAGIGRYDGKHWFFERGINFSRPSRALLVNGETLWIASEDGLIKKEKDKTQTVTQEQGLAGNMVYDFYQQGDKRLWILTNKGLSVLTL